jgi:DTW domain-containing protein YfiP
LCLCALIPSLQTRTQLLLVIHRYEDRKSTNTGRLATECLLNSRVRVRAQVHSPDAALVFDPLTRPVVMFPHPGAIPLTGLQLDERPLILIVPDGTWRQASKMRARVPGLADLPNVCLPAGPTTAYRLRAESHDGGLATMEAIARAFGILEGAHVQHALERVFMAMVERTRWARGEIPTSQVSCGVPPGAVRHNPRELLRAPHSTPE